MSSIRCAIQFSSLEAFRAAFVTRQAGCFVPWPEEIAPETHLELDITFEDVRLEVKGVVVSPDFDDAGNVGLAVELDPASLQAVAQLDEQLRAGKSAPAVFATTRIKIDAPFAPKPLALMPFTPGLLKPEEVVDDRFRIEGHLASGGMGDVYKAEHIRLKRPIALKLLKAEFASDPEMWGRFEREAQLVSALENPHVVRVFDFGRTSTGQPFLAMEFVEGDTLDQRLKNGPLAPEKAVEILCQVLDGLAEAHSLGVVHRDLKPPNIILGARREGGERAKILDFGIARLGDRTVSGEQTKLTQMGVVVGTPAYLAPEQALADELDHRTDIYAMGCVAYELLTGAPPFVEGDLRKIISAHLTAAPVHPAVKNPELTTRPALCEAVLRALAKSKEQRFQSVVEFREALRVSLGETGAQVSMSQLVPQASVPWPPPAPEWEEAPEPAAAPVAMPAVAPVVVVGVADDFFGGSRGPAAGGSAAGLDGRVDPAVFVRLAPPPTTPTEGVLVRVELMGVDPKGPAAAAALNRVTDSLARVGACFVSADEEGTTFAVAGRPGSTETWVLGGRAAQGLISAKDAVAQDPATQKAQLRAFVSPAKLPTVKEVVAASQLKLAKARAGTLLIDQRLAPSLNRVCELSSTDDKGVLSIGARRQRKRSTAELIGRKSIIELLEKRMASAHQGVGAPILLTGSSGSGQSTLTAALASVARKANALVVNSAGLDAPFGAVIELLCQSVGLELHDRARKLAAALQPLPIVESARQAALTLAGLHATPTLLTPGQAAYALRVVLRAAAIDRPMVVICDGLHDFDRLSRETFFAMVARPASRELLIGLGSAECIEAQQAPVPSVPIPPLTQPELHRLLTVTLGSIASQRLTGYVMEHAKGNPAASLELVNWLDERGSVFIDASNAAELAEPDVAPTVTVGDSWSALPPSSRNALLSAAFLGERFDPALLKDVVGQADPTMLQQLHAMGYLVVDGARRARLRSHTLRRKLKLDRTPDAHAMRRKCADALIARGRTDPTAVEPAQLAQLLTDAGEGQRAAPAWKHALEQAVAKRDLRAAREAWLAIAASLSTSAEPPQVRVRIEALSRAAALAVINEELSEARAILTMAGDAAVALQPPPAEYLLIESRVLRLEGRRVKAAEVLVAAEAAARGTPIHTLVLAEHGEAREIEGDLEGALGALTQALQTAAQVADFSRWHGEIDLSARLEARLATLFFARRDAGRAKALLESSLARWRAANWPWAEARVLSTLGTVLVFMQQYAPAASAYELAGQTAARNGDMLFQARAMMQQAKAIRKVQGVSAQVRNIALEARKICVALGWEQGRLDATALIEGQS